MPETIQDQAAQIWPVLVFAAQMQRVLTHSELEGLTGIPRERQGQALGLILNYCKQRKQRGYPLLNTIVVRDDGFPGYASKMTHVDFLIERAKVFAFNWSKEKPRSEDFAVSQAATA